MVTKELVKAVKKVIDKEIKTGKATDLIKTSKSILARTISKYRLSSP